MSAFGLFLFGLCCEANLLGKEFALCLVINPHRHRESFDRQLKKKHTHKWFGTHPLFLTILSNPDYGWTCYSSLK